MELGNFVEAEEMYQKAFGYMSVWPGTDNSSYPIIFESIGAARMRQQRWKAAEESLQKAIAIFDEQIRLDVNSVSNFVRGEPVDHLRESEDVALDLLGVVYSRQG